VAVRTLSNEAPIGEPLLRPGCKITTLDDAQTSSLFSDEQGDIRTIDLHHEVRVEDVRTRCVMGRTTSLRV